MVLQDLGGVIFFTDPLFSHPHAADKGCGEGCGEGCSKMGVLSRCAVMMCTDGV